MSEAQPGVDKNNLKESIKHSSQQFSAHRILGCYFNYKWGKEDSNKDRHKTREDEHGAIILHKAWFAVCRRDVTDLHEKYVSTLDGFSASYEVICLPLQKKCLPEHLDFENTSPIYWLNQHDIVKFPMY